MSLLVSPLTPGAAPRPRPMQFHSAEFDPQGRPLPPPKWWRRPLLTLARRHPVLSLFLVAVLSNVAGTVFNVGYNLQLIVGSEAEPRLMDAAQRQVFFAAMPVYLTIAYAGCLSLVLYVLRPVSVAHRHALRNETPPPDELERCRRSLVNWPLNILWLNSLGWFPGAIYYPLVVGTLAGWHNIGLIWLQFFVSFLVSALLTTVQTFFFMEVVLVRGLYPMYFVDASPAALDVRFRIGFTLRLLMLWMAVACMPLVALYAVAENFQEVDPGLHSLSMQVFTVGLISSALVSYVVGKGLLRWLNAHTLATERIARGRFESRIHEKRPDEWGRLTDRFNDMAGALQEGERLRETFGQVVHPAVRDAIIERFPDLTVRHREITILFADIRGFTRRTAGQPPEVVGPLVNRFLGLAVAAVDGHGGHVNKFLGDGVMALFGAHDEHPRADHADIAVDAALRMLEQLDRLNAELLGRGEEPLRVGIGIHSGPAMVGCFGAVSYTDKGQPTWRREFTAIGEAVNLAQRMEQLTKTAGGPILVSCATRAGLTRDVRLRHLGEHELPGSNRRVEAFQVLGREGHSSPAVA